MLNGLIFDIKEFSINDGPGIRLTIFFKGCPLRCIWCHNPEGLSFEPQINKTTGLVTGKTWAAIELAEHINKSKDLFDCAGGGVTFSGGEPTAQAEFLLELINLLTNVHKNLDTSGFCPTETFCNIVSRCDLVFFDLKLGQNEAHKKYTGKSNDVIIKNLMQLANSIIPYHIRIPLVPGVTDTEVNFKALKAIIFSLPRNPVQIELLPYNKLAGGKYPAYGLEYTFAGENEQLNERKIKKFIDNVQEETKIKVEIMK